MTTRHVAICFERGHAPAATTLALILRRAGITSDLAFSGKADKQFKRAHKDGAATIITILSDTATRMWRDWGRGVTDTTDAIRDYLLWLYEEDDTLPDPPAHLYSEDLP